MYTSLFKIRFHKCLWCIEDLLDFQLSASSVAWAKVHLGRMQVFHDGTPWQEPGIALEKTLGIWPGWAHMSPMEEYLFPSSDGKWCCSNVGVLPAGPQSWKMGFHQSLALPSVLVCYHLFHASGHQTALEDYEIPHWLQICGALGSPEPTLELRLQNYTEFLRILFKHFLKFWRGHLDLEIHGYGIYPWDLCSDSLYSKWQILRFSQIKE